MHTCIYMYVHVHVQLYSYMYNLYMYMYMNRYMYSTCMLYSHTVHVQYLAKAGSVHWVELLSLTEVEIVFIDSAAREADALLIVVVLLQPGKGGREGGRGGGGREGGREGGKRERERERERE